MDKIGILGSPATTVSAGFEDGREGPGDPELEAKLGSAENCQKRGVQ